MGMRNFPGCHNGQGATEYLVLLAVVLIVALVSVALLSFFSGMAGDAQMTQSKMYWSSASPIAITEWAARNVFTDSYTLTHTVPHFRVRNTGSYPITITKVIAGSETVSQLWTDGWGPIVSISSSFTLQPGEEKEFSSPFFGKDPGPGNRRFTNFINRTSRGSQEFSQTSAQSVCQNSTSSPGTLIVNNFGFEYIQYIENTQITKRQIGVKPVVIKCMATYN